jgi:hypothetical protein
VSPDRLLPIPPDALADPRSKHMLSAWIANGGLQISLNIGVWGVEEDREPQAWGILLADAAGHIADAIEKATGRCRSETLTAIKRSLDAELSDPTDITEGDFADAPDNDNDEVG